MVVVSKRDEMLKNTERGMICRRSVCVQVQRPRITTACMRARHGVLRRCMHTPTLRLRACMYGYMPTWRLQCRMIGSMCIVYCAGVRIHMCTHACMHRFVLAYVLMRMHMQ
jgi:hypothetical protein